MVKYVFYLLKTPLTNKPAFSLKQESFFFCISADFSLNTVPGGGSMGTSESSNFPPWHTASHTSLAAALQMNTLPLG